MAVVVAVSAALAAAPGGADAQVEIGGWLGYATATEFTTDLTICTAADCGPSWISRPRRPRAPAGGLEARLGASGWLALRVGLSLVPRGHGADRSGDLRVAALYLDLPVLLDARLARLGPVELWLGGGLAPATLLSCRVHTAERRYPFRTHEAPCAEPEPVNGFEYGPAVKHDLSWLLVPAMRFPLAHGSIALEARVSRGLLDMNPADAGSTRNRAVSMSVGYGWRVGG